MLPNFRKSENEMPKLGVAVPPTIPATTTTLGTRPAADMVRERGAPSIIGVDLLITGNLISKGEVQIDGEVQGDIHATHVVIGERARITGGIIAEEVVIRGHVMGSVRGKRVLLQTSSHVEGDVYHQTLAIEQGAFFEGKSRRSDDPIAGMARFEASASTQPVAVEAPTFQTYAHQAARPLGSPLQSDGPSSTS